MRFRLNATSRMRMRAVRPCGSGSSVPRLAQAEQRDADWRQHGDFSAERLRVLDRRW